MKEHIKGLIIMNGTTYFKEKKDLGRMSDGNIYLFNMLYNMLFMSHSGL